MTDAPPPFASIWFDCDSTLSAIEGIDELGRFADDATRARVAAATADAMDGRRPLAEVYEERLRLLQPTRDRLAAVGRAYVEHAVADAAAVVAALRALGKRVGIVSGGLEPAVRVLGDHLGVDEVRAVGIEFDAAGGYRGFDRASPLWHNDGKVEILRAATPRPVALVGDGITDLEAAAVVDRFVGFGGVVAREPVARAAAHFVRAPTLAALLPLLLTDAELRGLPARCAPLLRAAGICGG